ncbi:MAG: hypothetical protein WBC73_17995 [Phormidesmis sp.]
MLMPFEQGAEASTDSFAQTSSGLSCSLPAEGPPTPPPNSSANLPANGEYEIVRLMLFGSLSAVQSNIRLLHKLSYAEPNDWSKPISTGKANEVMAILTRRVRVAKD